MDLHINRELLALSSGALRMCNEGPSAKKARTPLPGAAAGVDRDSTQAELF